MKHKTITAIIITILTLLITTPSIAHPGGLDDYGGHNDRSTGEYHYHHGYPAHQHNNGICPYDFDDKTGTNSGNNNNNSNSTHSNDHNVKINNLTWSEQLEINAIIAYWIICALSFIAYIIFLIIEVGMPYGIYRRISLSCQQALAYIAGLLWFIPFAYFAFALGRAPTSEWGIISELIYCTIANLLPIALGLSMCFNTVEKMLRGFGFTIINFISKAIAFTILIFYIIGLPIFFYYCGFSLHILLQGIVIFALFFYDVLLRC